MADFWKSARDGFNSFWIADDPIEKKAFKPDAPIGSNGVFDVNGYVYTPEDRTPLFNGDRRFVIFDQMLRNTAIVAAGTRLFMFLIAKAEWTANPPEAEKDNPAAIKIAEQAYDMLFDMRTPWSRVVRKTASYRNQGFSLQYRTFKMRLDGAIGVDNIANRPQRTITRWTYDDDGEVASVWQRMPNGKEVEMPRAGLVYAVDDTFTDAPTGLGLFRQLAPHAERLNALLSLQEIGFATDLRGIPIARGPLGELAAQVTAGTITQQDRDAKVKVLKDFITDHVRNKKSGVMLPSDTYQGQNDGATTPSAVPKWSVELMTGQPTGLADIANAITDTINEMARILGVEHMLLGSDGTGSLALSRTKMDSFFLQITSTLQDLVEVYERDIIEPLAIANGWPEELIPTLGVGDISDQDIVQVTLALSQLATAGAPLLPNDPAVGEIMDSLNLSRRPEDQMDAEMDRMIAAAAQPAVDPNNPGGVPNDPSGNGPKVAKRMRRIIRSQRGRKRMGMAA